MESNKEEALKAKEYAVKLFAVKDYAGAKTFALKAMTLFPDLDDISQMVATFDIYVASETRVNGEIDFYSVLGLKPSADRSMVKKQYKKLAVLLHPDKNKTVGADGAFKLVSEAWTLLSDSSKRSSYDLKRTSQLSSTTLLSGVVYADTRTTSVLPPSFWTVCTSCQVQYEYLRKYVNKRLSCKNCRSTFTAVELGTAPIDGTFPVSWSTYTTDNGYGSHGYSSVPYFATSGGTHGSPKVGPGYRSAHGSEYGSSMSIQWGPPGSTITPVDSASAYHVNGYVSKMGKRVDGSNGVNGNAAVVKTTRPYKKRKIELNGYDVQGVNGNNNGTQKFSGPNDPSSRQQAVLSPLDARSMLIEKARTGIKNKLSQIKSALTSASEKNKIHSSVNSVVGKLVESDIKAQRIGPVTLVVPDSDFHDFDKDRTEECFKPKQIWALYDEEDGMPRLYCLIREVISVNPFQMHISYLSSKSDSEFGLVNWINSGFTKSCGHFRAVSSDLVEQVNMFSHLLSQEKAGRGGCVRIYPRKGDVWAVYRNWSREWNRSTPYDVRHQYEMVEVVGEFSEEVDGLSVVRLAKVTGFKTVYRKKAGKDGIWWIPRREMVRFSHQVPCLTLNDEKDLPEGCWELDPAATPDELLKASKEEIVGDENRGELVLKLSNLSNLVDIALGFVVYVQTFICILQK
ncbi:hypothetical protein V2J09_020777 [Rumex salicifolius]